MSLFAKIKSIFETKLYCSFCKKAQDEVRTLIVGPPAPNNKNHMDNEEILGARKMAENPNAFNATERFLGTAGKLNYNQKVAMFLTQIYLTKHLTSHF